MSGQDVLRERIARALWDHGERESQKWLPGGGPLVAWEEVPADDSYRRSTLAQADAVIAALGLTEQREQGYTVAFNDDERALHWAPRRRYVTLWERIEEDG